MEIGKRQTAHRVTHPQRGAGVVVYENGPSFFLDEQGVETAMRVHGSGASVSRGSYVILTDSDHGHVEANIVERGASHHRYWSPMLGMGWLVSHGRSEIFDGDDGRATALDVCVWSAGTPDYAQRQQRRKSKLEPSTPEEEQWITLTMRDGSVMGLRRKGPPDAPVVVASEPQLTLGGVR
jgi:hypothetical protein